MRTERWAANTKKPAVIHYRMKQTCFLCKQKFHCASKYKLFCDSCKHHSENYRFAEWLVCN
jgi:hypothetical protein